LTFDGIKEKDLRSKTLALFMLVLCGASFLFMFLVHAEPQAQDAPRYFSEWKRSFPPLDQPWRIPWWLLKIHTGNMLAYPVGGDKGGSTLTLLLVISGIHALWKQKREALVLLLTAPLVPAFLAALFQKYPYGTTARTMLYMAPAFCLLAGVGLLQVFKFMLPKRRIGQGIRTTVVIFLLLIGSVLIRDFFHPYKELPDRGVRQAFKLLARDSSPDDQWLVFSGYGPRTPDALQVGGGGAVFRYYLVTTFPKFEKICPGDDRLLPSEPPYLGASRRGGPLHVLAFRGDRETLDEFQWIGLLKTFDRNWGPGQRKVYRLKRNKPTEGPEMSIEVYTFQPRAY
jgi:hypothetical protein